MNPNRKEKEVFCHLGFEGSFLKEVVYIMRRKITLIKQLINISSYIPKLLSFLVGCYLMATLQNTVSNNHSAILWRSVLLG